MRTQPRLTTDVRPRDDENRHLSRLLGLLQSIACWPLDGAPEVAWFGWRRVLVRRRRAIEVDQRSW